MVKSCTHSSNRIPLEKVSTLNISGDVAVKLSGFMQVSYFLFSSMNGFVTEFSENENSLEGEEFSKVTFLCSIIRTGKHLYFLQSYNKNHQTGKLTWGTFHRTSRDIAASPKPCECLVFSSDFLRAQQSLST